MDAPEQTVPAEPGLGHGSFSDGSSMHLVNPHLQSPSQPHGKMNLENRHASELPCTSSQVQHSDYLHAPPLPFNPQSFGPPNRPPGYSTGPPHSLVCGYPQQLPGSHQGLCPFTVQHQHFQSGPGDPRLSSLNFLPHPQFSNSHNPEINPPAAMATVPPCSDDPNDLYHTSMRPCQMAHRRYLRWIHTVYGPEMSPLTFVREWCQALDGIRAQFGPFCLLDVIIFNQFLTAVAFNPQAHAWVDSIHVPMDNVLPPTLMDQVYVDFQVYESRRMHLPLDSWSFESVVAYIPQGEWVVTHYCPFHRVLGFHSMEDCCLHPMRKPNGKVRGTLSHKAEQTHH